jgi:spore coat polysaccharide biosynthesis predicted glycosyltransferase SpsG
VINGLSPEAQEELALDPKFTTISQPPNYLELISDSRAAITGAGVSALERVYLKNRGVIVVAADNQVPNYDYLTQHNFFSGYHCGIQGPAELDQAIKRGLSLSMPNNLIDGLAARRISNLIGGPR